MEDVQQCIYLKLTASFWKVTPNVPKSSCLLLPVVRHIHLKAGNASMNIPDSLHNRVQCTYCRFIHKKGLHILSQTAKKHFCNMPWRGGWRLEHKKKDKSRLWQSVVTRVEINSTKKRGKGINSINRGLKISTTSTNIRHLPKKIVQLSLGLKESTLCTYTPHIKLFPTRRYATRGKKSNLLQPSDEDACCASHVVRCNTQQR